MTKKEILNTPEIVDFMIDKSVVEVSRMKLHKRLEELCKLAIKALEQESCEDCISRKVVKEQMIKYGFKAPDMTVTEFVEDCLPSVTPTRPTGKWIVCDVVKFGDFVGTEKYECSKCHHRVGAFKSNFCPNCGARMTESEDKE